MTICNRIQTGHLALAVIAVVVPASVLGDAVSLDSLEGLRFHKVTAVVSEHDGRNSIHVSDSDGMGSADEDKLVILDEIQFRDGVIEVDVSGAPQSGAGEGARGFVGIAFRVAEDASSFDAFYLRPTNGRANNQLRRNHSAQYISFPDYPWHRLREDTPGVYESYVDLEAGKWTHIRIEVSGPRARLYVHGAEQPSLIVNDLKSGNAAGAIGFWIGPGTDAYFTNLEVSAR